MVNFKECRNNKDRPQKTLAPKATGQLILRDCTKKSLGFSKQAWGGAGEGMASSI